MERPSMFAESLRDAKFGICLRTIWPFQSNHRGPEEMSIKILMPTLSPEMKTGKLVRWLVEEDQQVNPGDVIAEIETEKASIEIEAVDKGKVLKLLVPDGT